MFDIAEELKNLPENPGVYLMHDKAGKIIYVGKAKVLKNRVRQYFQNSKNHPPKVRAMVSNISWFEYIITDTEMEALVLECNLIKKHKPRYNILLKDDKTYPYIKVTMNEEYPRVFMSRKLLDDGAKYFGPYVGMGTVNNTLDVVRKIFMPPVCKRRFPESIGKGRPCLNFHIKNCFAPCTGKVSQKEFYAVFEEICKFLEGDKKALLAELREEMKKASLEMDYERAATFRDKIKAIEDIESKQKIVATDGPSDRDVLAIAHGETTRYVAVFFIRDGKVSGRETYKINNVEYESDSVVLGDFIKQFYSENNTVVREIISEAEPEDREMLEKMLSEKCGKRVRIIVPKRGEKREFVAMVKKNAEQAAENDKLRFLRENKNFALLELQKALGLPNEPKRIESYDISNISGADSVGVMVVFDDGKPSKSKYRQFKIKTVYGADDYASTAEVIYRRFRRALDESEAIENGTLLKANAKFLPLPDLILADGGKGHVRAIKEMLAAMETDIPVFGLVKDNRHRTRGIVDEDKEIEIKTYGALFDFLTRVQDEVHRFAISCFKSLHSKNAFHSELHDIPGVGKVRRLKLMEYFGGIDKIRAATEEELNCAVDKKTAKAVFEYFNGENSIDKAD